MLKFFAEKMWVATAKATHIFSAKNIRIMYIESAKTVNEMTLNELVKLTTLWTTGPRLLSFTQIPFWKTVFSKRKKNCSPFRIDTFSEGSKIKFDRVWKCVTSPSKIRYYRLHKYLGCLSWFVCIGVIGYILWLWHFLNIFYTTFLCHT